MDASPLGRLPTEILESIITFLEASKDRKSLRSTCHALNNIALPWAFHHVFVNGIHFSKKQNEGHEGFPQLAEKYGHLVKSLDVDGGVAGCPFVVHPFLINLPNLHTITLFGSEDSGDEQWCDGHELFKQASLLAPSQSHIFQNLRSLEVDFYLWKLRGWWEELFAMPQLEELSISGLSLDEDEPKIPEEFHGQMNLKFLRLFGCYINTKALKKILSFPKALVSLELVHDAGDCSLTCVAWDPWSAKKVYDAISEQRASLERIALSQANCYHYEETGGDFDLSKFPKLKVYDGFYLDSSGKFKPKGY